MLRPNSSNDSNVTENTGGSIREAIPQMAYRIGLWENFNRKALYLMVKTCKNHGFLLRFSLKPIQ